MRVEIVANKLSDRDTETGVQYLLAKGDTVTVPDVYGRKLCDAGWARDLAPTDAYPNKPFTPGVATVAPAQGKIGASGGPNG